MVLVASLPDAPAAGLQEDKDETFVVNLQTEENACRYDVLTATNTLEDLLYYIGSGPSQPI